MKLWPRLPLPRARAIASSFAGRDVNSLQAEPWQAAGVKLFAPTGGVPVDDPTLRALRQKLEACAQSEGYPSRTTVAARRRFDDATMKLLADLPIARGEAVRAEMWAWVAVILVPHVVQWRWADAASIAPVERFAGGLIRNAFGRLWYQAAALRSEGDEGDDWRISEKFGADQAVALLERPSLAANRHIALAIGRVWAGLPDSSRKEAIFREAMKAMIVRAGIQRLDVLDPDTISSVIEDVFDSTILRMGAG